MSSDYSEADLNRALGITSLADYDRATNAISEGAGAPGWAAYDAELERIKTGRTRTDDLLDTALGINATEAEAAKAQQQLADADRRPWRFEGHSVLERYSRRGEEAHLAELYTSRLGESQAEAEAHVHRELSAAWNSHHGTGAKLEGVASRLTAERRRMESKAPVSESSTPSRTRTGPEQIRLANGNVVPLSELDRPRKARPGTVNVSETTQRRR